MNAHKNKEPEILCRYNDFYACQSVAHFFIYHKKYDKVTPLCNVCYNKHYSMLVDMKSAENLITKEEYIMQEALK